MQRTILLRALVALAIAAIGHVTMLVATERSAAAMTSAATAFVEALSSAPSSAARRVCLRGRRAAALALHPQQRVPP